MGGSLTQSTRRRSVPRRTQRGDGGDLANDVDYRRWLKDGLSDDERAQAAANVTKWRRERERLAAVDLSTDPAKSEPAEPVRPRTTADRLREVMAAGMTLYQVAQRSGFTVRTIQGHLRDLGWRLVPVTGGGGVAGLSPHVLAPMEDVAEVGI